MRRIGAYRPCLRWIGFTEYNGGGSRERNVARECDDDWMRLLGATRAHYTTSIGTVAVPSGGATNSPSRCAEYEVTPAPPWWPCKTACISELIRRTAASTALMSWGTRTSPALRPRTARRWCGRLLRSDIEIYHCISVLRHLLRWVARKPSG